MNAAGKKLILLVSTVVILVCFVCFIWNKGDRTLSYHIYQPKHGSGRSAHPCTVEKITAAEEENPIFYASSTEFMRTAGASSGKGQLNERLIQSKVTGQAAGVYRSHSLKVVYRDLSDCDRPHYLPEYKALCWGVCEGGKSCSNPVTSAEVASSSAKLVCIEKYSLIGVRKCGSTDIEGWFSRLKNVKLNKKGAYYPDEKCPKDFFAKFHNNDQAQKNIDTWHYGAGTMLSSVIYSQNSTHIVVSPATQFLGFMATPETKYHIQLRHPTDRAISYLFHWHRGGEIFKGISHELFSGVFTDYLLLGLLKELEECLGYYGELGCIYQSTGRDGVLNSLLKHSLYVVYIEEALRFIPKEQIIVTRLEDYSKNETATMNTVLEAFGIKNQISAPSLKAAVNTVLNKGKKNRIGESIVKMLDDFFMPYNKRLAVLLDDDRFLYLRN